MFLTSLAAHSDVDQDLVSFLGHFEFITTCARVCDHERDDLGKRTTDRHRDLPIVWWHQAGTPCSKPIHALDDLIDSIFVSGIELWIVTLVATDFSDCIGKRV